MSIEGTSHLVAGMGRVLGQMGWAVCLVGRKSRGHGLIAAVPDDQEGSDSGVTPAVCDTDRPPMEGSIIVLDFWSCEAVLIDQKGEAVDRPSSEGLDPVIHSLSIAGQPMRDAGRRPRRSDRGVSPGFAGISRPSTPRSPPA